MSTSLHKPRTIIYIDGFNFFYGAIKGGPYKWLNLERFFTLLRGEDDVCRIHYFTAIVNDPASQAVQEVYLQALRTLPLLNIILGKYKEKRVACKVVACTHAAERQFRVNEEKRTDVNIAVQMMEDAYERRCEQFIVVSGDSDLVPPVQRVRSLGKRVVVYIPARDDRRAAAVELRAAADDARRLPLDRLLPIAQFPDAIPDGAGGAICKPTGW